MSLRDLGALFHQLGDDEAETAWARVQAALDGDITVALLGEAPQELSQAAAEPAVVTLAAEALSADLPAHAALYATPYAAALGAADRARIADRGPLPVAVLLTERATLDQLSDDPDAEAAEVIDRVRTLLPSDVALLTEATLGPWLAHLGTTDHRAQRRAQLALHLIDTAAAKRQERLGQIVAQRSTIAEGLAELDSRVRSAAQGAERVAAGVRAAAMTAGEALQTDLDAFFQQLRTTLPRELAALDDWRALRTHLGPWLQHVITTGVEEALATWTTRLLDEVGPLLTEDEQQRTLDRTPAALELAELADVTGWRDRLPIALGLGGGVALVAIGQVIPGALTVFSSLAWRTATHEARLATRRDALLESAQTVVDVARLETISAVRERREALLAALDLLPQSRAQRARDQQREERAALVAEQDALERERSTLKAALAELTEAREGWSEVACMP